MHILTLENTAYEMNEIPDEVEDLRFAILDNSDPKNPDYFFIPLIFFLFKPSHAFLSNPQ